MPDSLVPACSQRSHFHPYLQCHIHCYLCAPSKARSTATSLLSAKPDSPLPVKSDPPLLACSQWSQIVRADRVSIPPLTAWSQLSQIVSGESERSTATSLHPAKPDCQGGDSDHVWAVRLTALNVSKRNKIHPYQCVSGKFRSTTTSLLPVNTDCQRG